MRPWELGWKCHQYVDNMSTIDQNGVEFQRHCSFLQCQFSDIPHMQGVSDDDREKNAIYFLLVLEYITQKEKNMLGSMFFALKFSTF